ncbi:hypothetical protein GCM10010191_56560 [Actinomadura vinacea]|uniref:Putative zinc-finger domain-containing protein n=1 Tax=Actinomadura vinacea TaxID=115336 RepID=A0ABN3JMV2_9ACTN
MGGTDCGEYRIGLGVYAIGKLTGDEAAELREHLAGCGMCRAELDELSTVADILTATMAPSATAQARTARGAGRRARTRPAGASSRLLNGACAASRPPGR